MRGARVDQAGRRVGDQRDGLARGRIGKAEEGDVGGVQQARALGRVLAQLGRRAQHLDVAAVREVLVDAKAGGAFLAIDENAGRHDEFSQGDRQHKARQAFLRAARLRRQWRFMATKKPKGLGLGLEALLGPRVVDVAAPAESDGEPHTLALDQLQPGRYQPRTRIDEGALYELAESIKAQGVMQPVLVRPLARPGADGARRFEIIAGERRFRAARLAGLDAVPVLVRDVSDEAAAAMALIENIQREDLNPLEEARGLRRLTDEFGMTHEAAARAVGRSRSATTNLLRLLNLSEPVQQMLLVGDLEMGHARAPCSRSTARARSSRPTRSSPGS